MSWQETEILVPILILAIPTFWLVVLHLIALASGWTLLSNHYRFTGEAPRNRWRWQSAQLRFGIAYSGVLQVGVSPAGLFLSAVLPFRPAHPPLRIPWSDIEVSSGRFAGQRYYELRFRQAPRVPFRISARLYERLAAAAGPAWATTVTPHTRAAA